MALLLLMNSFNKTEAAVFSCRLCFLRAFPFISLIYILVNIHTYIIGIHADRVKFNANKRQDSGW